MTNKNFEQTFISGKTIRTNNQNNQDIMKEWHGFMALPQNDSAIYAIYSNYETDFTGDYDFTIGQKTSEELATLTLPGGNYWILDTQSQNSEAVALAWQEIWANQEIPRSYQTDFELYIPGETIKIYLAIK